ncbi:MAG: transglutaminase-like domain-containing protein [Verrucomicrobiota bacterium]
MNSQHVQPPPRLLLGATLLFWGAMTGRPALALILALIIESPNWIRSRWNFNDQACCHAWHLSLVLALVAIIPIWLEGDRHTALPRLLTWLPLLLFPLQFVQSYGFHNYLNLNNFYLFSRLYRKRNAELGIEPSIVRFNFGNVYFIAILVASSLGYAAQYKIFFPGLVLLTSWLTLAHVRHRFFAMATILLFAAVIGLSGQMGMSKLYQWATRQGVGDGDIPCADATYKRTNIGSLGAIKQSPEMIWRLRPKAGQIPPGLLRVASYNRYKGVNWRNEFPGPAMNEEDRFRGLDSADLSENDTYLMLRENMSREDLTKNLPVFEIRGAARPGDLLPIPGNSSSLNRFLLQGIDINPLGTIRIDPLKSIIQGNVRWNDNLTTEVAPFPHEDLLIDRYEIEGIHDVADALGLKQLSTTAEKIQRIQEFFNAEFTYTKYLTIPRVRATQLRPTAIETFLTTNKNGHCEYFATAATLLLRAADVPARYSIGYAVMEKNPNKNEWVIRGTHAHAWTRVWIKETQRWVDFDPTPSSWLATEAETRSRYQSFLDGLQRFKEDFFLWRNEPTNRLRVTIVMWILALGIILYIVLRLKKSRVVIHSGKSNQVSGQPAIKTPLHDLEKAALKILGSRHPGETLVVWLRKLSLDPTLKSKLDEACFLHQQLRFDPSPPVDESHRLRTITQEIIQRLKSPQRVNSKK